jgi:hypothetical protein
VATTTTIATKAVEKNAEKKLAPTPLHRQKKHSIRHLTNSLMSYVMMMLATTANLDSEATVQE